MSKELKGYTNHLLQNSDGTIVKFFRDEGVTSRLASVRQQMESSALRGLPFTPQLLSEKEHEIKMTGLAGERDLDVKVDEMPERLQYSVFRSAGALLRFIHDYQKTEMPVCYVDRLVNDCLLRTNKIGGILRSVSIDPKTLSEYFIRECNRDEIERMGLGITHGDYWLNNIIGRMNSKFEPSGIIDWEMGGIGSPYNDFAVVSFSIEDAHPFSRKSFWDGYGLNPNLGVKNYFCIRQIVIWLSEDGEPCLESDFYRNKIKMLRSI